LTSPDSRVVLSNEDRAVFALISLISVLLIELVRYAEFGSPSSMLLKAIQFTVFFLVSVPYGLAAVTVASVRVERKQ